MKLHKTPVAAALLLAALSPAANAVEQATVVFPFNALVTGWGPADTLAASGGTLYGTTELGGPKDGFGTVFSINANGSGFKILNIFSDASGGHLLYSGVTLSGDTLYGTTGEGAGAAADGTIYSVKTNGTGFANLHTFTGADGSLPQAGLAVAGTTLYGATVRGGPNGGTNGVLFALQTDGTGFTNLHTFSGPDGAFPFAAPVIVGDVIYGTTTGGGPNDSGTLYAINTNGSGFTTLHSFATADGTDPLDTLVVADGVIYGTTSDHGPVAGGSYGTVFSINTNGTGFTVLHTFTGSDGATPQAGLALAGPTLYGATIFGGAGFSGTMASDGVVFSIGTNGSNFTMLADLSAKTGDNSYGGVVVSGSAIYGMTAANGPRAGGTIYKIALPSSVPVGTYNGLFSATNGVAIESAGLIKNLVVSTTGSYSGMLEIAGASHAFSGQFDLTGSGTAEVSRPAAQGGPLALYLNSGTAPSGAAVLTGVVSNASWTAPLYAELASGAFPIGEFNVVVEPPGTNTPMPNLPGGFGFISVTNKAGTSKNPAAGAAALSGVLADGAVFNQTAPVSADGFVALYAPLYANKGLITGWVNLTNASSNTSVPPGLTWIRPAGPGTLYPDGFTNIIPASRVVSAPWTAASAQLTTLNTLSAGEATFSVSISSAGKITGTSINGSVNLKTGVWTATAGKGAAEVKTEGALDLGQGFGFYLTKTNSQPAALY